MSTPMATRRRMRPAGQENEVRMEDQTTFIKTEIIPSLKPQSGLYDLYEAVAISKSYIFSPWKFLNVWLYPWLPATAGGGVKFEADKDIPDLSGKVILITGGNAGIGKEMIYQLAKHKPSKIFMAARTESTALEAIGFIKHALPADLRDVEIIFIPLDLTSLASVRAAALEFQRQSTRLDILMLNAGVLYVPPALTTDGFEIALGTNHIGHFHLTELLLPTLLHTASEFPNSDVRVVSVASEGNVAAPSLDIMLDTLKLVQCSTMTRYGASKGANIYFAAELARRYPMLTSVSVHPGVISSNLWSPNTRVMMKMFLATLKTIKVFQPVPEGAKGILWAAAGAKKTDLVNGGYYTPVGRLWKGHEKSTGEAEAKKIWEWTEAEIAKAEKKR